MNEKDYTLPRICVSFVVQHPLLHHQVPAKTADNQILVSDKRHKVFGTLIIVAKATGYELLF